MRTPDVAWISNGRLATVPSRDLRKFAHVCPDFVIELMSDSDEWGDFEQKMKKWLANGVRLGWLIDPNKKQTYIYRSGQEVELRSFSDALSGEDILPGLEVKLSLIF